MTTRTFVQASALLLALIPAVHLPAAAQDTLEAEFVPFVGANFFLSSDPAPMVISRETSDIVVQDGEFRDAPTAGVTAGLRIDDRFGLEGMLAWIPTRLRAVGGIGPAGESVNVNTLRYGLSALYHFDSEGRFRPFAGVGVARKTISYEPYATWKRSSHTTGTLTLGGYVPLSEGLTLRLQGVHDLIGGDGDPMNEQLMLSAGLSLRKPLR